MAKSNQALARQRIKECLKYRRMSLDLSFLNLSEIPKEISELFFIVELNLDNNQITKIENLDKLTKISKINLSNNQILKIENLEKLLVLTELNLSKNKISKIEGLGNLININELNLSNNQITRIEELDRLIKVDNLSLSFNQISKIEGLNKLYAISRLDLSNNLIHKIEGLDQLTNIQGLSLSFNRIYKIEGLRSLKNITFLDLTGNFITKIEDLDRLEKITFLKLEHNLITKIEGLGYLLDISQLYLSSNQITKIEGLGKLLNVSLLDLSCNQIAKIEGLGKLLNVSLLDLSSNQIAKIEGLDEPNKIKKLALANNKIEDIFPLISWLKKGFSIDLSERKYGYFEYNINLYNNPLQNPDIPIINLGTEDILNYFQQIKEQNGVAPLYEAKLIIVGEAGAGKTSLTEKLIDETHEVLPKDPKKESTLGINIKENWQFKDTKRVNEVFTAHIWDFGGQEIQYMTHQFFLTPESLYVLVADDRKQHTLFPYWFEIIHFLGKSENGLFSPIIVVLNEQKNKSITNFDLNQYRLKYPNTQIMQVEVDLADANLNRFKIVRDSIQDALCNLKHIGCPLPAKWTLIRQEIMKLNTKKNYVCWNDFVTICELHEVIRTKDQELISKYLHRLGVILHFQEEKNLKDFIIINPSWAMRAVYTVLEDKSVEKRQGKFTDSDLNVFWKDLTIPEQGNILNLMKKDNFEICYNTGLHSYIAPQLLSKIRPTFEWNNQKSLKFQYFYRFMPKGIMTRLIVRKHEYLSEYVWARGAIFNRFDCDILVTEEENEKDGLIAIEIIGNPLNHIRSLNFIRDEIEDIHKKWFSNISYDEKVPCYCKDCLNSSNPTFFSWNKLVQRVEQNKRTIECDNLRIKDVEVLPLLEGVYDAERIEQVYDNRALRLEDIDIQFKKMKPKQDLKKSLNQETQTTTLMKDPKKQSNWFWYILVLFIFYLLFVVFAPNGSEFNILNIFSGKKGPKTAYTQPKTVTVVGKIKINGRNANAEEIKQVYVKENTLGRKATLDGDIFRLRYVEIESDKLITIAIDLKNGQIASQLFKLPEPNTDNVCDLGDVLLEVKIPSKQNRNPVIIIKNQNIQTTGEKATISQ
jgi:internalin A